MILVDGLSEDSASEGQLGGLKQIDDAFPSVIVTNEVPI